MAIQRAPILRGPSLAYLIASSDASSSTFVLRVASSVGYLGRRGTVDASGELQKTALRDYTVILVDAISPPGSLTLGAATAILEADATVSRRSRIVVDLERCAARELFEWQRTSRLPLIVVDSLAGHDWNVDQLERGLLSDPFLSLFMPVVGRICSRRQQITVANFLRVAGLGLNPSVSDLAKVFCCSQRSLTRECARIRLRSPGVVHRACVLARAVSFVHAHNVGTKVASSVAGYRDCASFKRACRKVFKASWSELLRSWEEPRFLDLCFARAILIRAERDMS